MEDRTYDLNELATMTGFTTRTLRTYLKTGLLHGTKVDGAWRFTLEDLDRFFNEPFVKEGLRTKRSAIVYDFLAQKSTSAGRMCVVIDRPVTLAEGEALSAFFCKQMESAADAVFAYDYNDGHCRVILSGDEAQVARILAAEATSAH